MPALSTGFGLLSLIFVYSFVFGYLGGRSPALKSGPIIMFVLMTGISNQQSYSFQGLVDGALMVLLAGVIMTVVFFLFSPMRPEQALLRSLRRFFHGCARVTRGFRPGWSREACQRATTPQTISWIDGPAGAREDSDGAETSRLQAVSRQQPGESATIARQRAKHRLSAGVPGNHPRPDRESIYASSRVVRPPGQASVRNPATCV